jgi:hypothetical protein
MLAQPMLVMMYLARIDQGATFAERATANAGANHRFIEVGVMGSVTCEMYADDYATNDHTGTSQNSWPGSGKIVHLNPDLAGDTLQWQSSASATQGTATLAAIQEVTPDDATSYNKRTTNAPTTTPVDDWNVGSSSGAGIAASDAISLVAIGFRGGAISTTASGRSIKTRAKSAASGTVSSSATIPVNVNGWCTWHAAAATQFYQHYIYTDPTTAVAWTPTGTNSLDNMQIGYQADVSSANEIRVSTVWALVEYVPAASKSQFFYFFAFRVFLFVSLLLFLK